MILPQSACLRLILFGTCPPLCAGVLWPMPARVWRDVRWFSIFVFSVSSPRAPLALNFRQLTTTAAFHAAVTTRKL